MVRAVRWRLMWAGVYRRADDPHTRVDVGAVTLGVQILIHLATPPSVSHLPSFATSLPGPGTVRIHNHWRKQA